MFISLCMKCTRDRGNESMNLLLDCTAPPKVKWGRNEHWFNKPMISWSICVFPGCIYIPAGFYLPLVYEVLLVYYGIIYTWLGFQQYWCSSCICVLELFCVSCVAVYYDYTYVLFMRTLGLAFDVFSGMFQGFPVLCSKSGTSASRVSMFQLDKCTCVPRVNAPTVIKSPSCLHVSVFTY